MPLQNAPSAAIDMVALYKDIHNRDIGTLRFRKSSSFANQAEELEEGYLAASPGIVPQGALNHPQFALSFPEFIVGDDIVLPPDIAGIALRNTGSFAAPEGEFQDDATAVNGLTGVVSNTANNSVSTNVNSGGGQTVRFNNTTRSVTFGSTDEETRMSNRAYQLYYIVDIL